MKGGITSTIQKIMGLHLDRRRMIRVCAVIENSCAVQTELAIPGSQVSALARSNYR